MRDGATKRIWLYLLMTGGRSTPKEIIKEVDGTDYVQTRWVLASMAKNGHVKRYGEPGQKNHTYGVTLDCKIPVGVHLSELRGSVI